MSAFETETLDHRDADPATASASLRDIVVANTWFGGRQAVRWGVTRVLTGTATDRPITVLDVGAGAGDIAGYLRDTAPWRLTPIGLDHLPCAAALCRARGFPAVVADLHALPFARRAVDLVVVSQVLHHLPRSAVSAFLRGLAGLARLGVVIADLRRSHVARAGIWTASRMLGFHAVTRMDAVTSVRKGFSRMELDQLCRRAGVVAAVRRRPGWRLVAWWRT